MGRRTKEERLEREMGWQVENNLPNATCDGKFYIWNGRGTEVCPVRKKCKHYQQQQEAVKNMTTYDHPQVRFYYVDGFRNCEHRKKLENEVRD